MEEKIIINDIKQISKVIILLHLVLIPLLIMGKFDMFMCLFIYGGVMLAFSPLFRSLQFFEKGCKITFLGMKKEYKWEDIKIIRRDIFTYGRGMKYEGILFSVKNSVADEKRSSSEICHSHDFCRDFFVGFIDEKKKKHPPYAVNKELFLSKLEKWNVPVNNGKELSYELYKERCLNERKQRK